MNLQQRMGLFGLPALVVAIVVMLVVPIPTLLLDFMITLNLTAGLVILLACMHVRKPKDFSTFPALLLVATMYRLALNVSVTRLVLLHANAGSVIQSFGNFVVGGNVVVGLIVFLILIVIQFVVVTSGAGRVSEVAARFSLDAMQPKLISIDSELNSGLITKEEALQKRRDVDATSEFYGAMDGASKFVRGDAIAALVIVFINLLGGFAIGVIQNHDSVGQAIHTYSILSVGDGLVSQIPALLLSISTGIIVTRTASDGEDFGSNVATQFANQPRAIQLAGAAIFVMGLIPGLPNIPFMAVGAALFLFSGRLFKAIAARLEREQVAAAQKRVDSDAPAALAAEFKAEPLELEISPNLAPLADAQKGGDLPNRTRALRRQLAFDKGILVPKVRIRDNVELPSSTYVIRIHGVEVGRGIAPPGRVLAIGSGLAALPGEETIEPAFGIPAKWIPSDMRSNVAGLPGISVVDRSSAIITHLGEVIAKHAGELLSMQETKILLDSCMGSDKVAVDEMLAAQVSVSDLHRVLVDLLAERVPISDFVRIVESITVRAKEGKNHEQMVEAARRGLGPAITAQHARDGVLPILTLDVAFERALESTVKEVKGVSDLSADPGTLKRLITETSGEFTKAMQQGKEPVLVVGSVLRPALHRLFEKTVRGLSVMSYNEVSSHVQTERMGVISGADAVVA